MVPERRKTNKMSPIIIRLFFLDALITLHVGEGILSRILAVERKREIRAQECYGDGNWIHLRLVKCTPHIHVDWQRTLPGKNID